MDVREIKKSVILLCSAVIFLLCGNFAAASVEIITNGNANAVIILPEQPLAMERMAADELVEHIQLISGVKLNVISNLEKADGKIPILLGSAANEKLDEIILAKGKNPSSFALVVDKNSISIRGLSDEGTLFGVYELLEQLGVRWYIPGDLGRVIPKLATVRLEEQQTVQVPSFELRLLQPWQDASSGWIKRVRLGGEVRSTGSHGIPPFSSRDFASNPEWFAEVNGERVARQLCLSNPEVLSRTVNHIRSQYAPTEEKIYYGMGPNDGSGFCECENCKALDQGVWDPFYGRESMTDRYIWFFNQVLAELEEDYPNFHIVWYVYALTMMPPKTQPNPRIVHVFAPITLDRIKGLNNPMSLDRHVLKWLIEEWSKKEPNEMYYRGYYNNLACMSLPFSQVDRIRHEIPYLYEKGFKAMRVEVIRQAWASNTISLYLAARLMWDVNTDVDAVLDEFYEKFYGPAALPMKQYHETLDETFRDTPYSTGSSYVYFSTFDHKLRAKMSKMLSAAESLVEKAENELYRERVRIARQAFERMELFLDMIEERNRFDFKSAHSTVQKYYEITTELENYILEGSGRWAHTLGNHGYFQRFFEEPILQGYQRTVENGELVAGLPDEWDFLLDPHEIGELAGWYRADALGEAWQKILTKTRSWSDQGLHYYKGVAWYRTHVIVPEEFKGRKVYLWFGGIDEKAKVWVNGKLIGTSENPGEGLPGVPGAFRPFEMDVTDALEFGNRNPNVITVKITNKGLDELGTGGILAPVMLWSPKAGQ